MAHVLFEYSKNLPPPSVLPSAPIPGAIVGPGAGPGERNTDNY